MCSQESKAPASEAESNSAAVDVPANADEQTSEPIKAEEKTAPSEAEVPLKETNPDQEEKTVEGDSAAVAEGSAKEESAPVEGEESVDHPVKELSEKPSEASTLEKPSETLVSENAGVSAANPDGASTENPGVADPSPAEVSDANPGVSTDAPVPEHPVDTPTATPHATQSKRSAHVDDNSDDEYTSDYLEVSSKRRRRETRFCSCSSVWSCVASMQETAATPILKGQYFIHDTICTWEGKVLSRVV